MFVSGRQSFDLVLIANECLDGCLKVYLLRVLRNMDLDKAYNHVNWEFLFIC